MSVRPPIVVSYIDDALDELNRLIASHTGSSNYADWLDMQHGHVREAEWWRSWQHARQLREADHD